MKVLYIAGGGRSGSTILERILGRIDGFVSTGELRQIWSFGFLRNGFATELIFKRHHGHSDEALYRGLSLGRALAHLE